MNNYSVINVKVKNLNTEVYEKFDGVRSVSLSFRNSLVESKEVTQEGWRNLIDKAGKKFLSVSINGGFKSSNSNLSVQESILEGSVRYFVLELRNGHQMQAPFIISSFQRIKSRGEEESFSMNLESAGAVEYSVSAE